LDFRPTLSTILVVLGFIGVWAHTEIAKSNVPGNVALRLVSLATPFQCLSLATTLYTTSIIIAWLLLSYRTARKTDMAGTSIVILRAIEVVAESQLIYAVVQTIFVALLLQRRTAYIIVQNIFSQVSVRFMDSNILY